MKRLLIITIGLVLMSSGRTSYVQSFDTNAKLRATFIYNFTKYIDWPDNYKEGNFVIGLLSDNKTLYSELNKIASTKRAVNQPLKIKKYESANEIGKCHMLIVGKDNEANFSSAVNKVRQFSTLVIGEKAGWAKQGAGINFIILNNRQKFELNKSSIEQHNLKVASDLLSLAILVD